MRRLDIGVYLESLSRYVRRRNLHLPSVPGPEDCPHTASSRINEQRVHRCQCRVPPSPVLVDPKRLWFGLPLNPSLPQEINSHLVHLYLRDGPSKEPDVTEQKDRFRPSWVWWYLGVTVSGLLSFTKK